jgi:hypothetical protein
MRLSIFHGAPASPGSFGECRHVWRPDEGRRVVQIDHPLDPANRYLSHSFVESPDMKNIYDGVVTLNAAGEAVGSLPAYFAALNVEFRYQLTCIGGHAPHPGVALPPIRVLR